MCVRAVAKFLFFRNPTDFYKAKTITYQRLRKFIVRSNFRIFVTLNTVGASLRARPRVGDVVYISIKCLFLKKNIVSIGYGALFFRLTDFTFVEGRYRVTGKRRSRCTTQLVLFSISNVRGRWEKSFTVEGTGRI